MGMGSSADIARLLRWEKIIFYMNKWDSGMAQCYSAGLAIMRTWVWVPIMAGSRCEYGLFTSTLAQTKSVPHYGVELHTKPWLVNKYLTRQLHHVESEEKTLHYIQTGEPLKLTRKWSHRWVCRHQREGDNSRLPTCDEISIFVHILEGVYIYIRQIILWKTKTQSLPRVGRV